jgi:hypothetical protein
MRAIFIASVALILQAAIEDWFLWQRPRHG